MTLHALRLVNRLALAAPAEPDDDDMAKVNAVALAPLTADQVFIFSCDAINTRPMSSGLVVPEESVRAIAGLAYGAPIQRNHDTYSADGLPIGFVFESTMGVDDQGDPCNRQRFFMVKDPLTESLAARMRAGIIREVSVAFGYQKLECSIDGGDLWECSHMPGEAYEGKTCQGIVRQPEEYDETSLVWRGAADRTKIRMAAARFREFDELVEKRREHLAQRSKTESWLIDWAAKKASGWPEGFFKAS